jgi:hypothetical protein
MWKEDTRRLTRSLSNGALLVLGLMGLSCSAPGKVHGRDGASAGGSSATGFGSEGALLPAGGGLNISVDEQGAGCPNPFRKTTPVRARRGPGRRRCRRRSGSSTFKNQARAWLARTCNGVGTLTWRMVESGSTRATRTA